MRIVTPLLLLLVGCASTPVADVPFRLERNRPLIDVRIDGSEPLPFLLDSASQTPNLRGAADPAAFNFKIIGVANVAGAGTGARKQAKIAGDVRITIGAATLTVAELVVPEADPALSKFGVIGKPLFERFVVELDWRARRVRLYEPREFRPRRGAIALPLTFDEAGLPYVAAIVKLDGDEFPVSLSLDTGANLALALDTGSDPRIVPPAAPQKQIATGAQGALHGTTGRARLLRMGPRELRDVETDFAAPGSPFVGTPGNHGLIGTEILRRFRVTFDVPGKRLFLE